MQKHPILCFGETEPNILGAIDLFLKASQDPAFARSKELQAEFLNNIKPYVVELVRELSVYGPVVNDVIASFLKLGRKE